MATQLPRLKQNSTLSGQNQSLSRAISHQSLIEKPQLSKQQPNLSNAAEIESDPSEIFFKDIQVNHTYEIPVYVRNLTKKAKRIRIFQPNSNKFRCDYDIQGGLAPGLALKLLVSFESTVLNEFHDSLKIIGDGGVTITIPLHAYPSQSQIIFEPFVNFGFIQINDTKKSSVWFRNDGKTTGTVEMNLDKLQSVSASQSRFTIQAGHTVQIGLEYKPTEAGILRGQIEVKLDGQQFQKYIEVNATSVEFNRFIINDEGSQTGLIDFNQLYFGQVKEINCFLVNNTPKKYNFKTHMKLGQVSLINGESVQTPWEVGQEKIQQIMSVYPQQGFIDSYQQIPIKFTCNSKVSEKVKAWTRHYTLVKEELPFDQEDFKFSTIFEFVGDEKNPCIIHLTAQGIPPQVKINKSNFIFGECPMHESRDILFQIQNLQDSLSVDLSLTPNSYFTFTPKIKKILPNQTVDFVASFFPRNIGKFDVDLNLLINGSLYDVPLKFQGTSSTISLKKIKKRGPECTSIEFNQERNFIEGDNYKVHQVQKKFNMFASLDQSTLQLSASSPNFNEFMTNEMSAQFTGQSSQGLDNLKEYVKIRNHKLKYDGFVKNQRLQRIQNAKSKQIEQQLQEAMDKLSNSNHGANKGDDEDDDLPPLQFEQLNKRGISSPKLAVQKSKDHLYVNKPIGKYEPQQVNKATIFDPDPLVPVKKKFPSQALSNAINQQCNQLLSGPELQKIFAGPSYLDMGVVFVKSTCIQTFSVRNDLRQSISVKIVPQKSELSKTSTLPQIIPSGQTAGFDIVFCSGTIQAFQGNVKYIINDKHEFFFELKAVVDQVKLQFDKKQIKLGFTDDNEEMFAAENLRITNDGNSAGQFKWVIPNDSLFTVQPSEGTIQSKSYLDVQVIFTPNVDSIGKNDEQKLICQIKDGKEVQIKCSGSVNEPKCEFNQSKINFGLIACGKKTSTTVWLKNISRYSSVFQVSNLPEGLEVVPPKCKMMPDENKAIIIKYSCFETLKLNSNIIFKLRGGNDLTLPISVETIIPQVQILEENFNFGSITTMGTPVELPFTLFNDSKVEAIMTIDLRPKDEVDDGIECVKIRQSAKVNLDDSDILVGISDDVDLLQDKDLKAVSFDKNPDQEASLDNQSENSEDLNDEEPEPSRYYCIKMEPQQTVSLMLSFCPMDVRQYEFLFPIQLAGISQSEQLIRTITAQGTKPRFLMDPQILDFKKKIIANLDKNVASVMTSTLTNLDSNPLVWCIDTQEIDQQKCFQIVPSKGIMQPNEEITLKIYFNPYREDSYNQLVKMYLDNNMDNGVLEINLLGRGTFPQLVFDRKEIILPPVPLNITSRSIFRVINDGFDNLTLRHNIQQEFNSFKIHLDYLDGKNLSVSQNKVKIEVSFCHSKPISFTTSIEFQDDQGRIYPICVSGTTENSILTNYSYLQRSQNDFIINCEDDAPIKILENVHEDSDDNDSTTSPTKGFGGLKGGSVASSRSGTNYLGYTPIPFDVINRESLFIKNWLNNYVLSQSIQNFPADVIENNGKQFYELLEYMGCKKVFNNKINQTLTKLNRLEILLKQYEEILFFLKENGASLNTIRPHYLLNLVDLQNFMKKVASIHPSCSRISDKKFQYLANDTWTTLFYQIIKIYYLSRVNVRGIKVKNFVTAFSDFASQKIPQYYLEGSNLLSQQENLLLRWLEMHYQKSYGVDFQRIRDIQELSNSLYFTAVIQNYVPHQKDQLKILFECQNQSERKQNADMVLDSLAQLGATLPFTSSDLFNPSFRQIMLFIMSLYTTIPHYIPKGNAPIVFGCVLGQSVEKDIQLTNPTSKPVSYYVKLEGSQDFTIQDSEIKLEPKSHQKFKVTFNSRVSIPQEVYQK